MPKKKEEKVEKVQQPKPKEKKEPVKPKVEKIRTVDQMTIARLISNKTGLTITEIQEIIELEQKFTMDYIKRGRKVVKKNYLTLTPTLIKGKKFVSPLNGVEYELPPRIGVMVKVGAGFKAYISNNKKKMPEKICRFVDGSDEIESKIE